MELRISGDEMRAHGFPPIAIGLECDPAAFARSLFPGNSTIVSLQPTTGALPCLHLRFSKRTVRDKRALEKYAEGYFGAELVGSAIELGPTSVIDIGGRRYPALSFYGMAKGGTFVAGCLAALPAGESTLLLMVGVQGTRGDRPIPQAVIACAPITAMLESLDVETPASTPKPPAAAPKPSPPPAPAAGDTPEMTLVLSAEARASLLPEPPAGDTPDMTLVLSEADRASLLPADPRPTLTAWDVADAALLLAPEVRDPVILARAAKQLRAIAKIPSSAPNLDGPAAVARAMLLFAAQVEDPVEVAMSATQLRELAAGGEARKKDGRAPIRFAAGG